MMSGRIRTIKPEVLESEDSADLSDAAWRLWVSSWALADDHGNLRAGSRYLAAQVWQDTTRDVITPLSELIEKNKLVVYNVKGQRYAHVVNWERHQRIDNAGKPRVPTLDEAEPTNNQALTNESSGSLREPPRVAATLDTSPLYHDHDHDHDHDQRPATDPPAAGVVVGVKKPSTNKRFEKQDSIRGQADEVHEHFLVVRKQHNPKSRNVALTPKDRKWVLETLKRGLTVDDLKLACEGLFLSSFHIGENDRKTAYLDFQYVLRSPEKFIVLAEEKASKPNTIDGLPIIRLPDRDKYMGQDMPDFSGAFDHLEVGT